MRVADVVVRRILGEHDAQVCLVENQHMVEDLAAQRADQSFADRVRPRRLWWAHEDPQPAVLQHVQSLEQDRVHVQEVCGDHRAGLGVQELRPGRAATAWRRNVLLVAALVVASAAASTLTWLANPNAARVPAAIVASTFALPSDGQDPASVGCGSDATVLGETPVSVPSVGAGMLQLKYSPRCQAGWARFYLNPNSTPVLVEVRVQASDGRASAFAYLAEGNTPVYTDLPHPTGGCLTASVIGHSQNQDPITFATPCMQAG